MAFHPGPNGEFAVIRWSAPAAGLYQVRVTFKAGDAGSTDVHVLQGGQPLYTDVLSGVGDTRTFAATIAVEAGQAIDVAVGANGSYFSDTTLVAIRITSGP
jgi:hypothetical protein